MKANSTIAAREPELVGPRALRQWITGERGEYSRVLLLESGAPVEALHSAVGEGDAVLLPAESDPYDGPATAVRYRGALTEIGDELFLGERSVELQDYVAAGFIQLVGPTAVCLADAAGWQAFHDDADLARRTGIFPSALLDPRVLLADRSALVAPGELRTPDVIRVQADGRVSEGLRGEVIGIVDELPMLLTAPRPRAVALGHAVRAEGPARLDIGRYLRAIDLMRMLAVTNGEIRISGFGWSPADDGRADAEPLTADPFLIETADGFVLADTTTLRRHSLSPTTAEIVAIVQSSSVIPVAADRVARQLGVSASDAERLCEDAVAALAVHVGGLTGGSFLAAGVGR